MSEYELERISKGIERSYVIAESEEEAIRYADMYAADFHEDYEWTEWKVTDVMEEEDD